MAPRANWKGFLRLSLVTCPVALYPATSDSEKIYRASEGRVGLFLPSSTGNPPSRSPGGRRAKHHAGAARLMNPAGLPLSFRLTSVYGWPSQKTGGRGGRRPKATYRGTTKLSTDRSRHASADTPQF
jgi:hypothetical protein